MRKVKNSFLFLFVLMIGFSCKDDEDVDLFANGSRDITIQFSEFGTTLDRFCLVTDDDGRIYWDSLYEQNQALSRIQVPADKPVNITFGSVNEEAGHVVLETFIHVADDFSAVFNTVGQACSTSQGFINLAKKQVIIDGVTSAVEVAQSSLVGVEDQEYDGTSGQLSFWFNPVLSSFSEQHVSQFIVLRDRVGGQVKGLLTPDSIWKNTETVRLDFNDFSEVTPHIIQFNQVGQWVYGLSMENQDNISYLQANPTILFTFPPASNSLLCYLPGQSSLDVFHMDIRSAGFDFLGEGHRVRFESNLLPQSIALLDLELTNRGTRGDYVRYQLNQPCDYTQSRIRYENSSTWTIHQLGGANTDIPRPPFSNAILQSLPFLSESIRNAGRLEVSAYQLENPDLTPSMDTKFITNSIHCLSHQAIGLTETL